MTKKNKHTHYWSENFTGFQKLFVSILASIVCSIVFYSLNVSASNNLILGWDIFCVTMLMFSWLLFVKTNSDDLCLVVEKQDDGLKVIFAIVIVAVTFSLFGSIILMSENSEVSKKEILHVIISLSPILLSWFLLHTIFTIRYAHLYHDHNKLGTGSEIGGIDFPTKESPDYIDFAYFSFVIGMTFQVSDISVSSRSIRRFVLMHSLISFVFNTIIVALTINTLAGFKK